ncbi:MAG: ATP-binding protein [Rhodobacteraceae bacterium]|nr:ATP-binding protein [Paracoccaceae bacterium]
MASQDALHKVRHDGELLRLWQSAFGRPQELVARLTAASAVAAGLYAYNSTPLAPIWLGLYLAAQGLFAVVLSHALRSGSRGAEIASWTAFVVASASFTWLPLYLLSCNDKTLVYSSVLSLACLCVYNVWREEPPDFVLYVDVGIGWLVVFLSLALFLPGVETLAEKAILTLLTIIFAGYYSAALISAQFYRQRLREASERGIQAQKMEAIGQLSGGIAHDFKNILTVVQGNLELHDEITDPSERAKLVREAHGASLRATGLVSRLLTFARQTPLDAETIAVPEVLQEIAALSRRTLPESIAFEVSAAPDVHIKADRDGLISALLNLILNAKDAMQEPGGRISLQSHIVPGDAAHPDGRARASEAHLWLCVIDNGPGIPAHLLEKVTEPFFTTKDVGDGSGLGLAMASSFALQAGGTLKITSNTRGHARGTTVALHLPIISQGARAARS